MKAAEKSAEIDKVVAELLKELKEKQSDGQLAPRE